MATEPPPLFEDSDEEAKSKQNDQPEEEMSSNLFDVDLTKESSPEPSGGTDPLLGPPPLDTEPNPIERLKTEKESPLDVATEPVPKSEPQSDSFFDDSDTDEVKPKESATGSSSAAPSALSPAPALQNETPTDEKEEEIEEEEEEDKFDVNIRVTNPEKVGEGMNAYVAYTINTQTNIPGFKNPESEVRRRFSDFLGLYSRMSAKYAGKGILLPPAPEKSAVGAARIKLTKSEEGSTDFLEKRRASLQRYLMRTATHPKLRKDADFIDFLENPNELPKAKETSAVSGAGFMRLVKNVGESITKMTSKMSESDSWFEEKAQQFEEMETNLKKLHKAVEVMTTHRKELSSNSVALSNSIAVLANVEENGSISKALSRLSEVEQKIHELHERQVTNDTFEFAETVRDHICLIGAIKAAFVVREKAFNSWTSAQNTLTKKREQENKLKAGGKPEKLMAVQEEVKEWEQKMEDGQKDFESVSKTIKQEVNRYETKKAEEFRSKIVIYLEGIMELEQELIKQWEAYLPEAKAITA